MTDYFLSILSSVEQIGNWGYFLAFIFSALESLVIVGLLLPGLLIVSAFGLLSSQGYLNINLLILVVALGAILGDSISYFLGTKGVRWFHNENKWLKISHLELAKEFFEKHGGKSVLIARFVGPLRPMIPFVAGLVGMKQKLFLLWNISSAFIWSASNLLLWYFFGNILITADGWITRVGYLIFAILILYPLYYFNKKYKSEVK